jgi:hypothetical protein
MDMAFTEKPQSCMLLKRDTLLKWCGRANWNATYNVYKPKRLGELWGVYVTLVLLGRAARCLGREPIVNLGLVGGNIFRIASGDTICMVAGWGGRPSHKFEVSRLTEMLSGIENMSGMLWGFKNGK